MRKAARNYGSRDARRPCFLAAVSVSRPDGAGQADEQGKKRRKRHVWSNDQGTD